MANMVLIESKTVDSGGVAYIEFTNIPQTYTDLLVKVSARDNGNGTETNIRLTFNGVGGTSYSGKLLYGSGSSAFSYSQSSAAYLAQQYANASGSTSNTFCNLEFYIPNYTSSNYKSVSIDSVVETNATGSSMGLAAGLFSNSAAITSIKLVSDNPANVYSQHTTVYLYGISNVTSGSKATGGIISSDGTYWYHMFPYSGTFTPTQSLTADYLVIAGGGGGSYGGGGAGGLRSTVTATGGGGSLESALSLTAQAYTVTVGAGGAKGSLGNSYIGQNGSNSVFSTITSTGGGGGAYTAPTSGGSGGGRGNSGGSGAAGTTNQGYAGGTGGGSGGVSAGGGGGAGAVGASGSGTVGAAGGVGVAIPAFANATQTGVNTYYAGGGGGGGSTVGGLGGLGGGAAGTFNTAAADAVVNTGGGGAGSYAEAIHFSNGGSGLVIIRYAI